MSGSAVTRRSALLGLAAAPLAAAAARAQSTPFLDVPYVPTPAEVVDRMLAMASVGKDDFVMDLGCGDGRMLIAAAVRFGARGLGVDLNPRRIAEAKAAAAAAKVEDRVAFEVRNLFDTPLAQADVLTMYLLPDVNLKLRPRILSEMKPGSRVVSHGFHMGDWRPDSRETVDGRNVFMWRVPADCAGAWSVADGPDTFSVTLRQQFQSLEAEAPGAKGVQAELAGATLKIVLDLGDRSRVYEGRIDGRRLVPLAASESWTATRR